MELLPEHLVSLLSTSPETSTAQCLYILQQMTSTAVTLNLWLRTAPNMLASAIPPLQYKKTCRITLPVQGFLSRRMINFLEAGQIAHTLNMELT